MKYIMFLLLIVNTVVFEHVYDIHIYVCLIKVVLQNNESMRSQTSMQIYRAPAGRKYITV